MPSPSPTSRQTLIPLANARDHGSFAAPSRATLLRATRRPPAARQTSGPSEHEPISAPRRASRTRPLAPTVSTPQKTHAPKPLLPAAHCRTFHASASFFFSARFLSPPAFLGQPAIETAHWPEFPHLAVSTPAHSLRLTSLTCIRSRHPPSEERVGTGGVRRGTGGGCEG